METGFKLIFTLILFIFLLPPIVSGQPKGKVEYYSTEQGLSHQRVTTMLKDREGFMWFGSWDGINRFDGHHFVSYKSSPGDSSQIGNDRIDQIVEDQTGHLWLTAYDAQVYRFDKKTGKFLALSKLINPDGRRKVSFRKILAAINGLVWLESVNDGVFCVPQADISREGILKYNKGGSAGFQLPSNTINFFHQSGDQIWIGTSD